MTGGTALFLGDRTFVGTEQYGRLFGCAQLSRSEELHRGPVLESGLAIPWLRRVQVALMIVVSLVTALILNRDLVRAASGARYSSFRCLLSPVVVGLIWRWILQRQGLFNVVFEAWLEPR